MTLYFLGGTATFEAVAEGEEQPTTRQFPLGLTVTTTHPLASDAEYRATLDGLRAQLTAQNPQLGGCTTVQVHTLSRLD